MSNLPQFAGLRATVIEDRPHKVWVAFTLPGRDIVDCGEFFLEDYLDAASWANREEDPAGYMHRWYFSNF